MSKWVLVVTGICLAMMMTGCLKTRVHVTVNRNGSADLEYTMAVDRDAVKGMQAQNPNASKMQMAPGDISKQMMSGMESEAKKKGITVKQYQEGKYEGVRMTKHAKNIDEAISAFDNMKSSANDPGSSSAQDKLGLTVKRNFFFDTYSLNMKMGNGQDNGAAAGMNPQMAGMEMTFALTMPVKPGKNNATKTEDGGRTLVWDLNPAKTTVMQAEVRVPRLLNIGLVLLGLLAIIGGAIVAKRKR